MKKMRRTWGFRYVAEWCLEEIRPPEITLVDCLTRRERNLCGIVRQLIDEARGKCGTAEIDIKMYPPPGYET